MKKNILIIGAVVSVIWVLAFFVILLVNPYFKYINTHTWATVSAKVELSADADGGVELIEEYLQGDMITAGDVSVVITDIGSEGTVKLKVQSGNLYDEAGNAVEKFKIGLDKPKTLSMDGGTVTFEVTSNRYE